MPGSPSRGGCRGPQAETACRLSISTVKTTQLLPLSTQSVPSAASSHPPPVVCALRQGEPGVTRCQYPRGPPRVAVVLDPGRREARDSRWRSEAGPRAPAGAQLRLRAVGLPVLFATPTPPTSTTASSRAFPVSTSCHQCCTLAWAGPTSFRPCQSRVHPSIRHPVAWRTRVRQCSATHARTRVRQRGTTARLKPSMPGSPSRGPDRGPQDLVTTATHGTPSQGGALRSSTRSTGFTVQRASKFSSKVCIYWRPSSLASASCLPFQIDWRRAFGSHASRSPELFDACSGQRASGG